MPGERDDLIHELHVKIRQPEAADKTLVDHGLELAPRVGAHGPRVGLGRRRIEEEWPVQGYGVDSPELSHRFRHLAPHASPRVLPAPRAEVDFAQHKNVVAAAPAQAVADGRLAAVVLRRVDHEHAAADGRLDRARHRLVRRALGTAETQARDGDCCAAGREC